MLHTYVSLVVFLIWMAPILEKMKKLREETVIIGHDARRRAHPDVELPSCIDIVHWEEGPDMQSVEINVKRIVREVAREIGCR